MSESKQWTIAQYHADREYLSHSALEIFVRSPKLYKRWFDGSWVRSESAAMVKGSAVHVGVLEPRKWPTDVMVCSGNTRSSKPYKTATEEHGGIVLLQNEEHAVRSMIDAVTNHEQARKILDGAISETSWSYEIGGFPCKCRPDILREDIRLMADLKTAADPSEDAFVRQAAALGYHRQAAFYLAAFPEIDKFLWIVVGSTEPFDCYCYVMDSESIEIGDDQVRRFIWKLGMRRAVNDWTEWESRSIRRIELPAWYKRKEMADVSFSCDSSPRECTWNGRT